MSNRPGILGRIERAGQRRMTRWLRRRMFTIPEGSAIVSFTFDDFPRSALLTGGRILEQAGLAGTYYASLGLMKQTIPTGEIFPPEDLPGLVARGHELGCHTYNHCPAWETSPADFEAAVVENAKTLQRLLPGQEFPTHSYPISWPRPDTKRRMASHFAACRGGGQTFNVGAVDLNYLAAFFIEQCRDRPEAIKDMIAQNQQAGGWLIFATHDVDPQPTRYGCTPELFQDLVTWSVKSGAQILPVHRALQAIQQRDGSVRRPA